jgi:hypothetical protein
MWTGGHGESAVRDHVLTLARRGEIASLEEAALIADVTRDTVRRWLNLAGIDWRKARAARIVKHRERTFAILQGKPARKRLTKDQQRAIAERAKKAWDTRHS